MTEQDLFDLIDEGIDVFKKNEGYQKRIKVNKRPHSDWLVFNWRQLTWKENDLEYLIEVCPNFDKQEKISSWTLYAAVSYDFENNRYNLNRQTANEVPLEFIATNINELLVSSFNHITGISKEQIPFAVELKSVK